MEVVISRSAKPDKRLQARYGSKTVHFGARGGSTYIDHGDAAKKRAWEARHRVREDWQDYSSAGALSKHLLWNKTSLQASIRDLNTKQSKYRFALGRST